MRSRFRKQPWTLLQKFLIIWALLTILSLILGIFVHEYFYYGFIGGGLCGLAAANRATKDYYFGPGRSRRPFHMWMKPFEPPRDSLANLDGRSARARKKKHDWNQPPPDESSE